MTTNKEEIKDAFKEMLDALIKAFPGFSLPVSHQQFWLDALRKESLTYFDIISGTGSLCHDTNLAAARITLPIVIAACVSVKRARAEREWQALKTQKAVMSSDILSNGERHKSPFVKEFIANIKALLNGTQNKVAWRTKHEEIHKKYGRTFPNGHI